MNPGAMPAAVRERLCVTVQCERSACAHPHTLSSALAQPLLPPTSAHSAKIPETAPAMLAVRRGRNCQRLEKEHR